MALVQHWLTRTRIVWLTIAVVAVFLLADGFVTPSTHEVHTPSDIAVNATLVGANPRLYSYPQLLQPTQSLDSIRCQLWRTRLHLPTTSACPDGAALAVMFFPNLTQSPKTLYFLWPSCTDTSGAYKFNLEYQSSSRTLVLHCYTAEPLVWRQPMIMGVVAQQPAALLVVPTDSFLTGTVNIVEDDRVEHLVGDSSTEYSIATVTIA
jgi:hypothetical protein